MEEKIYERQVTKQAISKRVIDEQQIDRHYNQNDLQELYKYELEPDDERILPILPKDRLFANMLKKYEDMIYKYHEHDTLLENKEEETLGEDERKQAWEEFEQEKNRPQFAAQQFLMQQQQQQQQRGIGPVTSNNIFGIRTDVLLKLLSMKARLDNPNMTDGSVKQAIPLLMQELYRQMDRGELTVSLLSEFIRHEIISMFRQLYQQLLALSSSLEVPPNYGGQFRVNENMMQQTYNSMNSLPTTSSAASAGPSMLQRAQVNFYTIWGTHILSVIYSSWWRDNNSFLGMRSSSDRIKHLSSNSSESLRPALMDRSSKSIKAKLWEIETCASSSWIRFFLFSGS